MPLLDLSMPLSILVHEKESGAKQGIQSDWRLVNLTMVVKSDLACIFGSYFWIYISGRTEKISGALFVKEYARGRKILSGQMHPWSCLHYMWCYVCLKKWPCLQKNAMFL